MAPGSAAHHYAIAPCCAAPGKRECIAEPGHEIETRFALRSARDKSRRCGESQGFDSGHFFENRVRKRWGGNPRGNQILLQIINQKLHCRPPHAPSDQLSY